MKYAIPLVIFAAIAGFLYAGLALNPREVPSPLIGKPAPAFSLPTLADSGKTFSPESMRGRVWLFNIWGTWCASCRVEHPVLVELARQQRVEIIGLNYKDDDQKAKRWLIELGDPYVLSAVDKTGRIGIDWGFYGAPETFVVDAEGIVRHKHIGPVSASDLQNTILPLVDKLRGDES